MEAARRAGSRHAMTEQRISSIVAGTTLWGARSLLPIQVVRSLWIRIWTKCGARIPIPRYAMERQRSSSSVIGMLSTNMRPVRGRVAPCAPESVYIVEKCQSRRIRLAAGHIPAKYASAENGQAWTPNSHKLFNVINLPAGQIEHRSHPNGKLGTQSKIIEPNHSECGSRIQGSSCWSSTSIRPQKHG
jgi:hypothetical protein